jgi:DNA-binding winged helix-turn-helix (wHTH) protein/tetratricopeptide (TPR) repeat protein
LNAEVQPFESAFGSAARRPVDLACEEPFRLGSLAVAPGLREIVGQDGRRQILEPRVMQVLVALVRANGAIVSRDELIRTCWNGTTVCGDAINRPISLLRRMAEGIGQRAFRIETIPRVGYRLVTGSDSAEAPASVIATRFGKRRVWAGFAALLAAAGALSAWPAAPQGPAYSILLQPFRTPATAANFNDQLSSALTSLDVPTVGGRNALTLTGSVGPDGTVNARLMTPGNRGAIWSGAISRTSPGSRDLADAARIVGTIAQCALAGANDAGELAPELLSLYARTCELGARGQNALGLRVARELTVQAPDFAAAWFALSHHALALYFSTPRDGLPLRQEALAAAERLIALRPDAQDGYLRKALALDPRQRVEREQLLRRAAGLEPIYVDGAQAVLSDFLREVWRMDEAFQLDLAIAQQNPAQTDAQLRLASTAALTGRWSLVDRIVERVSTLDPSALLTFWHVAIWRGDWAEAERRLPPRDPALDRIHIATYRALASGDAERKEAAARQVIALGDACCGPMKAVLLTQLGQSARAIALLEKLQAAQSDVPPRNLGLLFPTDPAMRSLWHDPAIEPVLRRHGLIDYWRASGTRPDVCGEPRPPAFCRLLRS